MDSKNLMIGVCIFALIPGFIAKAKGRSFWGYYFLGVIFSPLVSFLIIIFLKSLTPDNVNVSSDSPVTVLVQSANETENYSIATEIREYKDLFDDGLITQEEFEAKKKQLLGL